MTRRNILISLLIVVMVFGFFKPAEGQSWVGLIRVVTSITSALRVVRNVSLAPNSIVPHSFPFGGHITSSERACSLRATVIYTGPPFPFICPNCFYWALGGRAIEVGPPVPTNGRIIAFPWISDIYRNHSENQVGPWALGLGFTPFPLDQIK